MRVVIILPGPTPYDLLTGTLHDWLKAFGIDHHVIQLRCAFNADGTRASTHSSSYAHLRKPELWNSKTLYVRTLKADDDGGVNYLEGDARRGHAGIDRDLFEDERYRSMGE